MSVDEAADLYEVGSGTTVGRWTKIADHEDRRAYVGSTRWHDWWWLVVRDDVNHSLWALKYGLGRTEDQEHELPWRETTSGLELTQLWEHVVTRTEWRTSPPTASEALW